MIIFGTRGKVLDLGRKEDSNCEICGAQRPFHLKVQYKYFHLYWILRLVTSAKYFYVCNVCNRGTELDKKKFLEIYGRNPIPVFDRFGILLVVALVVGIPLVLSIGAGLLSLFPR